MTTADTEHDLEWVKKNDLDWLSDLLGKPKRTLYSWQQRGYGPPAYRIGGELRFRQSDVETWLEAQRDRPAG